MREGESLLQEGQRKGPYKISSKKLHQETVVLFRNASLVAPFCRCLKAGVLFIEQRVKYICFCSL